jgi:hypothetical protein
MSTVAVIISRPAIIVGEIVTIKIIHESIVVVIYSVIRFLTAIRPHGSVQIFVVIIDPRINNGDDHMAAATLHIPRGGRLHSVQIPQFGIFKVIGKKARCQRIIRLNRFHVGIAVKSFFPLLHGDASGQ